MSIINEALRKAEAESKKIKGVTPRLKTNRRFLFFTALLLCIECVIFVKIFIPELVKKKILTVQNQKREEISEKAVSPQAPSPNKETPSLEKASDIPAPPVVAPPPPIEPPALTLNGIAYDKEKPYTIVNGRILTKGDVIEGATLIRINRDSVRFVFKEKEFEIKAAK